MDPVQVPVMVVVWVVVVGGVTVVVAVVVVAVVVVVWVVVVVTRGCAMSLDSYLAYITEADNAEFVAQTRLPALCDARVRAAFFAMTLPRVPGHGLYVLWEMIAGVRSQNRALRAEMVAHGLWRHGPGAAEWNARMAGRRERLAAFSRSAT